MQHQKERIATEQVDQMVIGIREEEPSDSTGKCSSRWITKPAKADHYRSRKG